MNGEQRTVNGEQRTVNPTPVQATVTATGTRKSFPEAIDSLLAQNFTWAFMTFIRQLFQSLLAILENFTEEDAWVLLCAAGVNYFVPENLRSKDEANEQAAADQDVSLLGALGLEADCPVWAWKSGALSATFLWKKEADLDVRDRIYLA